MGGPIRGGEQPDDWWLGDDGNWYPPSAGRHPAALPDQRPAHPDGAALGGSRGRTWLVRAALVLPLALVVGLLVVVASLTGGPSPSQTASTAASSTSSRSSAPVGGGDADPTTPPASGSTPSPSSEPGPSPASPPGTTAPTTSSSGPPPTAPDPTAPSTSVAPTTTPPPPAQVPTDVEQCRHGGWADLVDDEGQPFANQGQCVAFVRQHD